MNILLILQACQCPSSKDLGCMHHRIRADCDPTSKAINHEHAVHASAVCITGYCSWQTVVSPVMLAAAILAALCGLMPCCVNSLTLLLTLFTAWGGGTNKEPGKHWHQSSQGDR